MIVFNVFSSTLVHERIFVHEWSPKKVHIAVFHNIIKKSMERGGKKVKRLPYISLIKSLSNSLVIIFSFVCKQFFHNHFVSFITSAISFIIIKIMIQKLTLSRSLLGRKARFFFVVFLFQDPSSYQ